MVNMEKLIKMYKKWGDDRLQKNLPRTEEGNLWSADDYLWKENPPVKIYQNCWLQRFVKVWEYCDGR
jgi:hypothetical protein